MSRQNDCEIDLVSRIDKIRDMLKTVRGKVQKGLWSYEKKVKGALLIDDVRGPLIDAFHKFGDVDQELLKLKLKYK